MVEARPGATSEPARGVNKVRARYLASSLTGAMSTALVPLIPFLAFNSAQSGAFTLVYTCFLVTWSVVLSSVCDATLRLETTGTRVEQRDYVTVTLWLSVLGGGTAVLVAVAVGGGLLMCVAAGVAVFAGVLRNALRYDWVMRERIGWRVLGGDTIAAIVFIAVVVDVIVDATRDDALQKILLGWAVASLVGAGFFLPVPFRGPRRVVGWYRRHRRLVLPLIGDTALFDAGGSLAPITMLIWLPLGQFGIYRAVSSVGSPVQILLDPIRPRISRISPSQVLRGHRLPLLLLGGAFLSGLACLALQVVDLLRLFPMSVLGDVAQHAPAAAAFVFANTVAYFLYLVARGQFSTRLLLVGRIAQTLLQFAVPIIGVLLAGLDGAINGFAVGMLIAAAVWLALHAVVARGASAARAVSTVASSAVPTSEG